MISTWPGAFSTTRRKTTTPTRLLYLASRVPEAVLAARQATDLAGA